VCGYPIDIIEINGEWPIRFATDLGVCQKAIGRTWRTWPACRAFFFKTGANNRGVWTAMTQASRQTARDTPTVEPKPNKGWNTKRERRASNQLLLAAPKQN